MHHLPAVGRRNRQLGPPQQKLICHSLLACRVSNILHAHVVATEQLLINCYLLLRHVQINRGRHGVGLTPQQFLERFSMWQLVTEARDAKQQAALACSLKILLKSMQLLPQTVQAKQCCLRAAASAARR
jgi:hypothetical protein